MFASVGGRGRSQITPGVPPGENRTTEIRIQRDQDPILLDGVPPHLAIWLAGKASRSGAEHVQSERGFRPDRDGHAQVLIKEEAHLICG